jgi:hypothetical protein
LEMENLSGQSRLDTMAFALAQMWGSGTGQICVGTSQDPVLLEMRRKRGQARTNHFRGGWRSDRVPPILFPDIDISQSPTSRTERDDLRYTTHFERERRAFTERRIPELMETSDG